MSLTKKYQPVSNNNQQSVAKPTKDLSNLKFNKNQIQTPLQLKQSSNDIKDVSYVNITRNRKIHLIYLSLIMVLSICGFAYFKNYRSIEIRTLTNKEIVKDTEVIYRDVTRDVSSISRSRPTQYHYNSKFYEEEVIRIKVRNEIDILLENEFARFALESKASRDLKYSRGSYGMEDPEINNKHEKNRLRIRAEQDRRLCELLQDKIHCAHWENFKKVSDQI